MENPLRAENKNSDIERLIGKAAVWAEEQSNFILENGTALSNPEIELAKKVGVEHPELVRILEVDTIPAPTDSELKKIAETTGLFNPNLAGITFYYGIYIKKGEKSNRLVSHELRHVYQYEKAGSIKEFLKEYVQQLLSVGYENAPLELDARNSETAI
jgi:hypothetical protein